MFKVISFLGPYFRVHVKDMKRKLDGRGKKSARLGVTGRL